MDDFRSAASIRRKFLISISLVEPTINKLMAMKIVGLTGGDWDSE
jgi:hypothetical protein